jgi:hypothetical protein
MKTRNAAIVTVISVLDFVALDGLNEILILVSRRPPTVILYGKLSQILARIPQLKLYNMSRIQGVHHSDA